MTDSPTFWLNGITNYISDTKKSLYEKYIKADDSKKNIIKSDDGSVSVNSSEYNKLHDTISSIESQISDLSIQLSDKSSNQDNSKINKQELTDLQNKIINKERELEEQKGKVERQKEEINRLLESKKNFNEEIINYRTDANNKESNIKLVVQFFRLFMNNLSRTNVDNKEDEVQNILSQIKNNERAVLSSSPCPLF